MNKWYEGTEILRDFSLEIESGELVCLIGESGIGKSTILQLVTAEQSAQEGDIIVAGYNVRTLKLNQVLTMRRRMGVIFEDFRLLPRLTVYENIAYVLEVTNTPSGDVEQLVTNVLKRVGLSHKASQLPATLSGGEQQRVAIARALVHRPEIILADEPTGNLDPQNAHEVAKLLDKLCREDGITVVIATHDVDVVDLLRPRVVELGRGGEIIRDQQLGTYYSA